MRKHVPYFTRILTVLAILASFHTAVAAQSLKDRLPDNAKIADTIGIKPGMIIGEAGAGTGDFTVLLAERVGAKGHVYANDIDTSSLNGLKERCRANKIGNVTTVVGEVTDPLFPVKSLDMVVMHYVFHDLEKPVEWMNSVIPYMKPDAPMIIIDLDRGRTDYGSDHPFLSSAQVKAIMEKTGFEFDRMDDTFLIDTIYYFKRKK